jgi:flagellar basal body-associated protein FliL
MMMIIIIIIIIIVVAAAAAALLVTVSNYKLDSEGVQGSDGRALAANQKENIHFSTERGMRIRN